MKPKANHSDILFLIEKLKKFMAEPLINKINMISNLYDLLKTATFYRYSFKSIGKFSVIKKPILINNPQFVSIGERVQIRNGMRLEVLAYAGEKTPQLTIGNFTNIEQNLHLVCHSRIKIGDYVTINANCCIVDLTHPYDDIDETLKIGARVLKEDSFIEIGDETFIGFGSVILPNVKIGKHVVIGANSVVTKDIPSYSVVAGIPAKIIKKYVPETKTWEKV